MNKNNPIFSLKNFRSFGDEGADFELAPITILTGCNSAGKSSLVKALMLLSEKETNNTVGGVQFSQNLKLSTKTLGLGGYNSVAHEDGKITMSYRIWSADLQEEIIVTRVFCAKRSDALNEGKLYQLTVEKADGTLIYQVGPESSDGFLIPNPNPIAIKDQFSKFYAVGSYLKLMERMPFIMKRENEANNDGDSKQIIHSRSALSLVKKRLKTADVSESEAVLLGKEFHHKTFAEIINATKLVERDIIRVSDLLKNVEDEDDDWKQMREAFISCVVNDACSPFFTQQIAYINSASAQISRLYPSEDNNKISKALRVFNERNICYNQYCDISSSSVIHRPGSFMNRWIKKFEIGDSIEVKGTDEGLGLLIFLRNGKTKRLLADEGYGITQLLSLLMHIDNSIPVFFEPYMESLQGEWSHEYKPQTICVEEPEIHLHPKYQSLLAELFVEAYQKYNIHFIIETHSEYLIRKLQVMVADKENTLTADDVSLNYIEKDENGVSTNRKIEIREDGSLSDSFGSGFFDEATGLSMDLLRMKIESK